jgi:hypothetical protein
MFAARMRRGKFVLNNEHEIKSKTGSYLNILREHISE